MFPRRRGRKNICMKNWERLARGLPRGSAEENIVDLGYMEGRRGWKEPKERHGNWEHAEVQKFMC